MALALNNLKRVDMTLNKETKPNLSLSLSLVVRMFAKGSILRRVVPKTQKWFSMSLYLTLNFIKYGLRVSGAIQGKE